jgi:hypothetical protein
MWRNQIQRSRHKKQKGSLFMRIVTQSVCLSYSPYPLLSAPRIAGLLPAPKPPPAPTYRYANPGLSQLSEAKQAELFAVTTLLLDVALSCEAGEMSEHALNTALAGFRRAIIGRTTRPLTPAQYVADSDVPMLQLLMELRQVPHEHS